MNKKAFSERDICTKFITPALETASWDITIQSDFGARETNAL